MSNFPTSEDVTMLQNFLNQFRERNSTRSDEHLSDLERAITRLREMVGIDQPREMTAAYLGELRAAVEAVVWAMSSARAKAIASSWASSAFGGVPTAPGAVVTVISNRCVGTRTRR